MTCESDGNCDLQDLIYEYDITDPDFGTLKDNVAPEDMYKIENENPFIEFDANKCILCGKCVRVDKEIQCSDVLEFSERGYDSKIFTPFGLDIEEEFSDCVHCGQCVEMCPTGALTYIPSQGKGREYDFDKVETTCPYCGVGCHLELKVKDNEIVEVGSIYKEGLANPVGETCVKGRFAYDFINHPDRLTKPLIKRDGEFEEASWDEALEYTAEKLTKIKEEDCAQALANLTSARCSNEENYVIQKFMRAAIGTNTVDHCAHL
jgi:predicted molibdopterin-dependent oxidoreductase YjgC